MSRVALCIANFMALAALLGGCYLRSDTILTSPSKGGTSISEFNSIGPTHLSISDPEPYTLTLLPKKQSQGRIIYDLFGNNLSLFKSNAPTLRLVFQRLHGKAYVGRFSDPASPGRSGVFVMAMRDIGGIILGDLSSDTLVEKLFPDAASRPRKTDGAYVLRTVEQARVLARAVVSDPLQFPKPDYFIFSVEEPGQ